MYRFQISKSRWNSRKTTKKSNPTESVALLIFEDESGNILMEKRAESGIWGSLYSLPELLIQGRNSKSQSSALLADSTLNDFDSKIHITNFKHLFTHYTLEASVFKVTTTQQEILTALKNREILQHYHFISPNDILSLPKPKPIADVIINYLKKLLENEPLK